MKEIVTFLAHSELITDCVEITGSDLLATSSLDGFIRIWSLDSFKLKTELEDVESKKNATKRVVSQTETVKSAAVMNVSGVRSLSYTPEFGGNLLSCGYNNYINVWSPESSLSKAYMGKLDGHNGIVLSCKVFTRNPNCISIDDKFTIKIWDVRNFNCIQTIRSEAFDPSMVSCISVIPGDSRFLVGGKRLLLFTNEAMQKDQQAFDEELIPFHTSFNPYFNTFNVVTKNDIRVYDAITGQLKKVLTDLTDQKTHAEITSFQMGPRNRKFFVADNNGHCKVFNVKSGEMLSSLFTSNDALKSQQSTKQQQKKSREIVQIIYVEDQRILISATCDATIRVYEVKPTTEVELLREIRGGHNNADLTCLEYSQETLTLYTGGSDGTIACWNFESSKLVAYFKDDANDITMLTDMFPYPAVLAGDARGIITCWKTKDLRKQYPLIFKLNIYDPNCSLPIRPLGCAKVVRVTREPSEDPSVVHPEIYTERLLQNEERVRKYDGENFRPATAEEIAKVQKVAKMNQRELKERTEKKMLILGTGNGYLHVYDLEALMSTGDIEPLPAKEYNLKRHEKFKVSLYRKDSVNGENCTKILEEIMAVKPKEKMPIYFDNSVYTRMWRAHKDSIASFDNITETIEGFISSGSDRFVKMWSISGNLHCQINIVNPSQTIWNFPYDWVRLILRDLEEVFKIVEQLDHMTIGVRQREMLQIRYLYNNFLLPEFRKSFPPEPVELRTNVLAGLQIAQKVQNLSRFGE